MRKSGRVVKRIYDLGKKAAKSNVGRCLVCEGLKQVSGNAVYRVRNAVNSDLENTGLNYGLDYAYNKFR